MLRFWTSGSRGSDRTAEESHLDVEFAKPIAPGATDVTIPSPKRRRPSSVDTLCGYAPAKRIKTDHSGDLLSPVSVSSHGDDATMSRKPSEAVDLERAREVIQYQFGLEILLKHDELRLINQELAKCQVALEQLRRCHLIPYPTQCPTPSQMLDISSGKGPALQAKPGQPVPKWAPPFGVVEGPYARHYAKWLIPDPVFDGVRSDVRVPTEASRSKTTQVEGRTTRNSMADLGPLGKQRSARGVTGQRLQALSSGYPQPKDKQAPCVLRRSDGITVKLVCIDCHRWDFSSTQGFINHCRIAHRRDFKSHEEAAVHCGHPIEVDEAGGIVGDESKPNPVAATSGLVHPLVRDEAMSEQQAYQALLSRVRASLDLYRAGKPSGARDSTQARADAPSDFVASPDVPFLSQFLRKKNLVGNLSEQVEDAKSKVDWDLLSPVDDSDMEQQSSPEGAPSPRPPMSAARTPAVMRVPARSATSPPQQESPTARPVSSKTSRAPAHFGLASTDAPALDFSGLPIYDDDMDVDLSPNTITSNNAPSLVSDDGEYDDSDDGSGSETSEVMETESVSDVAEINIDEDPEAQDVSARPIHHCRAPGSSAGNLQKDEPKHVTFVGPITAGNTKGRRKQKI